MILSNPPRYSRAQMRAMHEFASALAREHPAAGAKAMLVYRELEKAQRDLRDADKKAREAFAGVRLEKPKPKRIKSRASKIPMHIRRELDSDPFMDACVYTWFDPEHECQGHIEWEHPWIYDKTKIQERWALVPLCYGFHRGTGFNKEIGRLVSLLRMRPEEIEEAKAKYPRFTEEREQKLSYLKGKYPKVARAYSRLGI